MVHLQPCPIGARRGSRQRIDRRRERATQLMVWQASKLCLCQQCSRCKSFVYVGSVPVGMTTGGRSGGLGVLQPSFVYCEANLVWLAYQENVAVFKDCVVPYLPGYVAGRPLFLFVLVSWLGMEERSGCVGLPRKCTCCRCCYALG